MSTELTPEQAVAWLNSRYAGFSFSHRHFAADEYLSIAALITSLVEERDKRKLREEMLAKLILKEVPREKLIQAPCLSSPPDRSPTPDVALPPVSLGQPWAGTPPHLMGIGNLPASPETDVGTGGDIKYETEHHSSENPQWCTRVHHGPYVAYHYIAEAADSLTKQLNSHATLLSKLEELCVQWEAEAKWASDNFDNPTANLLEEIVGKLRSLLPKQP